MNERPVRVTELMDAYSIVFYESLLPVTVIQLPARRLAEVGAALGKRHPNQDVDTDLTRANYMRLLGEPRTSALSEYGRGERQRGMKSTSPDRTPRKLRAWSQSPQIHVSPSCAGGRPSDHSSRPQIAHRSDSGCSGSSIRESQTDAGCRTRSATCGGSTSLPSSLHSA